MLQQTAVDHNGNTNIWSYLLWHWYPLSSQQQQCVGAVGESDSSTAKHTAEYRERVLTELLLSSRLSALLSTYDLPPTNPAARVTYLHSPSAATVSSANNSASAYRYDGSRPRVVTVSTVLTQTSVTAPGTNNTSEEISSNQWTKTSFLYPVILYTTASVTATDSSGTRRSNTSSHSSHQHTNISTQYGRNSRGNYSYQHSAVCTLSAMIHRCKKVLKSVI